MHPISISLKGSREKAAQPDDGQIGPLCRARQEKDSPHLSLCQVPSCHRSSMARNTGERPGGQGASLRCSDGSVRGPEEAPSDLPSSPACAVLLIGAWHSSIGRPLARHGTWLGRPGIRAGGSLASLWRSCRFWGSLNQGRKV